MVAPGMKLESCRSVKERTECAYSIPTVIRIPEGLEELLWVKRGLRWVSCIFGGFHGEEVWEWAGREDLSTSS